MPRAGQCSLWARTPGTGEAGPSSPRGRGFTSSGLVFGVAALEDSQYLLQPVVWDVLLGLDLFALLKVCQETSSTGKQWLYGDGGHLDHLPTAPGTEVNKL